MNQGFFSHTFRKIVIQFYCIGQNGVTIYSVPEGTNYNLKNAFVIDDNDNKWVGYETSGLGMYNGSEWVIYNTDNSNIPSNEIEVIFEYENTIYIGTKDNGIGIFDGETWQNFNTDNGILNGESSLLKK